ncbi:unnamed protein product [Ectocarpus sp. CCAP 1310/34]|nr:unnamed protein product [Ectocarpus sp. CCAP 1310/34]
MAVLKEQGILQQLGDFGLSSLRGAVVIDDGASNTLADGTARVRYTGLVGAIDTYLEAVMAWDKSEAAARLGVSEGVTNRNGVCVADEDAEAGSCPDHEGRRPTPGDRNLASPGDRSFASPMQPPFRPGKKPIVVGAGSANTVARAARGWDNDAPVVPLGLRQYPRKKCAMAALVGNGGFGDGQQGGVRERERRNHYSPSSAMKDAFRLRGTTPSGGGAGSEESALATPSPQHSGSSSRNNNSGHPSSEEEEGSSGAIYDIYDGSAGRPRNGGSSRVDFRPAGGNPGLERADWSGGRRGSACMIKGMSGVGVSRSIRQDMDRAAAAALETPTPTASRSNDDGAVSPGDGKNSNNLLSGEGEELPPPRRRQSNTDRLKELVQAWPEVAAAPAPTSEPSRGGGSNGSDDGGDGGGGGGGDGGGGGGGGVCVLKAVSAVVVSQFTLHPFQVGTEHAGFYRTRALLAGVFRQLSGAASGHQVRDGLDKARLVKLFCYARMPLDLSHQEAEELADAVLRYCGAPTARFASLTTFLAKTAVSSGGGDGGSSFDAPAINRHKHGPPTSEGLNDVGVNDEEEEIFSPMVRGARSSAWRGATRTAGYPARCT